MTSPHETTRQATDSIGSLLAVVNLVRTGRARTRPGLAQALGLGRSVITQRVEQAIEIGYLEESDLVGASTGGRAPRLLRFRADRGHVIVCTVGGSHLHVGISDLNGRILSSDRRRWDAKIGPVETFRVAQEMIDTALTTLAPAATWSVIIGLPAAVDFDTGRPISAPTMPDWEGFDVTGVFHPRYGAPVWVDSDVNLLALAERARRAEHDNLDLLYVKVGTGIAASFLFSGRLHRGAAFSAGRVGHLQVRDGDGITCRCGRTDCVEAYSAGWALIRDAQTALDEGQQSELAAIATQRELTPEDIALAARNFDPLALQLVARSAKQLGRCLADLASALNPSAIVVGGAISSARDAFLVPLSKTITEHALPTGARSISIEPSQNDKDEPIRGGNALAAEQLFEVTFSDWFADGSPVA